MSQAQYKSNRPTLQAVHLHRKMGNRALENVQSGALQHRWNFITNKKPRFDVAPKPL